MSDIDESSVIEIAKPMKGKLKRIQSSDEEQKLNQENSIEISDQSELFLEISPKKNQVNKTKKQRKPQENKRKLNAANLNDNNLQHAEEILKPKKQKKFKVPKESNDKILQLMFTKPYMAEEEDEPVPRKNSIPEEQEYQQQQDEFGGAKEKPQRNKPQKAKNINQMIKNRHKFFTEFEDQQQFDGNVEYNQDEQFEDQELKFEQQANYLEASAIKHVAQKQFQGKVNQYKQKVQLFDDKELGYKQQQQQQLLKKQQQQQDLQNQQIQQSSQEQEQKQQIQLDQGKSDEQQELPSEIQEQLYIQKQQQKYFTEEQMEQPIFSKQNTEMEIENVDQKLPLRKTFSLGIKRGLSQQEENADLEIYIPKINGAKDQILEATLYFNKIKQQGVQKLNRQNTISSLDDSKKAVSRSQFQKLMLQKCDESKKNKQNINLNTLMNRFQSTTFEQLEVKKQQKEKNKNGDDDDSSEDDDFIPNQKELNADSEDIDDASSQGGNKEDKQNIIDIEAKQNDNISNEESENENEDVQQNSELNNAQIIINISDNEQDSSDEEKMLQKQQQQNDQQQQIVEVKQNQDEDLIDEDDLQMFRRLKNVSHQYKLRMKKQKELEEKRLKRQEKMKEFEQMRKKINSNYIENQAEQGSDNESHDDVVKQHDDDEDEEDNDQMEKELVEMIDDNLQDINEENELQAFRMFMDRVHDQEKEDIRKILRGEFKRKNGRIHTININELEQTEVEKQALFEQKYEESDNDKSYDSEEVDAFNKMNQQEKEYYLQEKRLQKILKAQAEIKQQAKKNRIETQQLFDKEILKMVEQSKFKKKEEPRKVTSFRQTMIESKKYLSLNENSTNYSNSINQKKMNQSKNVTSLNKLLSANLGSKGIIGQQMQKSPNKVTVFGNKK